MFGRRSVWEELREIRDMAVSTKTLLDARVTADLEHHRRVEEALTTGKADRVQQHAEGQAQAVMLRTDMMAEVGNLHGRINGLIWKIVAWQTLAIIGLLTILAGAVGWLVSAGPWAPHAQPF